MFTLLGADGKEYGPVTIEQVKAWILEGRSNLDTKAKRAGEDVWRRLGDFSEFSASATAVLAPPVVPPAFSNGPQVVVDPKAYAAEIIARAPKIDIGGCVSRGWELLKADLWPIVGTTALFIAVYWVACMIPILGMIAAFLLTGVFYGGLYRYYLLKLRGQPAGVSDLFSGFSIAFAPLMLASVVISLLTAVGMFLLILPGIYLAVGYAFTFLLVIDKKLEFWTAMEVSRRVVTAQWWRIFGLAIVSALLAALGGIALGIGMFFTLPIAIGAFVAAYEDLFNVSVKDPLKVT